MYNFLFILFFIYLISLIISRDGITYTCCYDHYYNGSTCVGKSFIFFNVTATKYFVFYDDQKDEVIKTACHITCKKIFSFFPKMYFLFTFYPKISNLRNLKFHLSGCLAGFYGTDCLKPCDKTFYGEQCSEKCNCSTHICHHIHGCIFGKNIYIYIFGA